MYIIIHTSWFLGLSVSVNFLGVPYASGFPENSTIVCSHWLDLITVLLISY